MSFRFVQLVNALLASVVGVPRKVMLVSPVHFKKATAPILVTPSGREVNARLEQLKKAWKLMLVNPSGRDVNAIFLHSRNANPPI